MDRRRRRRIAALALGAAALVAASRHPSFDVRVLAHDPADRAPHRVAAAAELGLASVSLLVTWTAGHVAR